MPSASQIELPERYRVERHIASGGMASVWEAQDLMLRRTVAVKLLGAHFAQDSGARERFQREARTAAQISDRPNIVTIYDIGEYRKHAFIVMEYCAGGTVADRLRAARGEDGGDDAASEDAGSSADIPRETALRWLREAAAGLDVAHAAGIVHRDVKPANLMLDARDRLAVGDFGIARLADDTQMTQTGQVLGTAAYLSPEQALGQPATAASDRYALAVVAYELLTGSRPFTGGPPAAQARQHVEAPPPRASQAAPELPRAVDAVLMRGLAKEPSERPPTATAFVDELERALDTKSPTVVEPTRRIAAVAPTAPTQKDRPARPIAAVTPREPTLRERPPDKSPPRPDPAPSPRRRDRRFAPLALLAVAALAIGGIAALAAGGDDEQPSGDRSAGTATQASDGARTGTAKKAAPAPSSPQPTTSTPTPALSVDDLVALDARGFDLIKQKKYAEAVPLEQQAVEGFRARGDRTSRSYGFALYNLGTALNRSGRPGEAIPFLAERLKVSPDDRPGVVEKELAAARAAAGDTAQPKNKKQKDGGDD